MLTFSPSPKPQRKDLPWLLLLMVVIWIGGATFFHSPWEPYEPYVVAVVKSIINTNSWIVPYISTGYPYLDLQPFYFWIYALIIKIFNFSDIANAIRVINTVFILAVIALLGRIGSGLNAYKNGRSVIMILISSIGFINNAYQLSPNIIILLGFALYFYALQKSASMPGISSGLLAFGLILISINFTGEFLLIALFMLLILPIIDKRWRNYSYCTTTIAGIFVFALIFGSYIWQLNSVDHRFLLEWEHKYTAIVKFEPNQFLKSLKFYFQTLLWYLIPSWILVVWTIYKRRSKIFADNILYANIIFAGLLLIFAVISGKYDESPVFPIIIPFVLIASVEIDSIRISIVSLLNWFSIFTFGISGICVFLLYAALNFGHPRNLFSYAQFYAPGYIFNFNIWQLALAIIITVIWIFMVTRKHIRGREMVTNWASGTTFCLVIFVSLCLPWFDSLLSFKDVVGSSEKYLNRTFGSCIATPEQNRLPSAIWYYFADVRLRFDPDFMNGNCKQALIVVNKGQSVSYPGWHVVWSAKRPIDVNRYVLLERN